MSNPATDRDNRQADPFQNENKRLSWNTFGADYWLSASESSRPSASQIECFLRGARTSTPVAVLGGTTIGVIAEALEMGADVHVFDFAERVLEGVEARFGATNVTLHLQDLTHPLPSTVKDRFDIVIADRLINRFHRSEMPSVLAAMLTLVKSGGVLRTAIRFGLSPFDERVITTGRRMGALHQFWDPQTRTIDWARTGEVLARCARSDGKVPRDVVIAWSCLRGVESRLEQEDIALLINDAGLLGVSSRLEWEVACDRNLNLHLFSIVREDTAAS